MELPEARPGLPWDKEFENRAYIRWACSELTQLIHQKTISFQIIALIVSAVSIAIWKILLIFGVLHEKET